MTHGEDGRGASGDDALRLFGRRWVGGRWSTSQIGWAVAALVCLVLGAGEVAAGRWHSPWPVSILVLALVSLPLAVLPTYPWRAGLVAVVAFTFECVAYTTPQSLAVLFAMLGVAGGMLRYTRRREVLPTLAAIATATVVSALRDPTSSSRWDYLFTFGIWLVAAIGGLLLRGRHEALLRAIDETVRLRTEQGLAVEKAIVDERARIARDLHDVVAHAVSLMVIQAAAGRSVLAREPASAASAFDTIEDSGQRALGDLRRLLGVIASTEGDQAQRPGLSEVEELVQAADAAGLPCRLTWSGEREGVPDGVDVAAFRVVQEGVTNALKHGAHVGLDIAVTRSEAGVRVALLDRFGSEGGAALPGAGQGLRGMRERVALYDGTLATGPDTDGWRVEAFFPLRAGR